LSSESKDKIKAMMELASSESGVPILPDEMDKDGWLFNVPNGTIDLRTGSLRAHDRADLITQLCPVEFLPSAKCPLWDATLKLFLVDQVLIDFWQRLCGYAMAGVVRDHILPVAYGSGSNGKSTILGALLEVFGPDYAMKAGPDLFMAKNHETHPTDRTDLFRKRLVAAIESEQGHRLNETMVKELTGGDRIRARRMREDFWEFSPTHTFIMGTNHKPAVRGTDRGIWRRLKLVPFSVVVEGGDADPAMPEKLRGEFPGILAWCVRGCLEWQKNGLQEPESVTQATKNYRAEQDVLGAFLGEHTVENAKFQVKAGDLYGRYKKWAELGSEHVLTMTAFGLAMQERGIQTKVSNGKWYLGIGLRDSGASWDAENAY
jgi:putative DNA primase/helicase